LQIAATTTPGTTTYSNTALFVCTEYEYRVRAYSGTTMNGPYSTEATGATLGGGSLEGGSIGGGTIEKEDF
jgi:hypothetical protein